jgi:S1-C subfamily serine protease
MHRSLLALVVLSLATFAFSLQRPPDLPDENWGYASEDSGGGSSYLGVDIADVTSDRLGALKLKEEHGAEITMVDSDAPAGKAGLKEHDVILSVNGTAVESAAQLRRMIRETPSGRIVNLGISRDGQPMNVKLQLADRGTWTSMRVNPQTFQFKMPAMPDIEAPISIVVAHSSARSGLMVENITPQLGEFFGVKNGNGVLIRSVEKGSRAEKSGFRAGDVIVKVNSQMVHDASDFTHALRGTENGTASVTVMRDKKEQILTLSLPERKDTGELEEDSLEMLDLNMADLDNQMVVVGDAFAKAGPAFDNLEIVGPCVDEKVHVLENSKHKNKQKVKILRDLNDDGAEI